MASQITHIVLVEKLSDKLFVQFDKTTFLAGTVFPDIRYLNVIDREKTHFKDLSFQNILDEKNSFIAGLKYHSLVDEAREKYIVEKDIYSLLPSSKFITQALKIYEDEILYLNVYDWNMVATCLDTILPEETALVENIEKIKIWHLLMQKYFKETPTDVSRKNYIMGMGFSEEIATEVNQLICQMRQISEIREIILELYKNWDLIVR